MPAAASRTPLSRALVVSLDHPLARFAPLRAIGGALDGHGEGETLPAYAPESVRAMSAAGLGAITYRLRTELGVQAWHFDQSGSWSEPARQQGYWTGTSRPPRTPPAVSWGYELPRRGDTTDQAEDGGYSRLDDGSTQTFWKSDPYLDSHFTHEPEARHPQWVVIDLGRLRAIDALRIAWAAPYGRRFRVQRYVGGRDAIALDPGRWIDFPHGAFDGAGGVQTVRLAHAPMSVRFVRVLMTASSHTSPPSSHTARFSPPGGRAASRDVRDRLGYAIRELYLGVRDRNGTFRDLLVHSTSKSQTTIYTSSTDPWHRAADLNRDYEQPSFQTVLGSGLTRAQPLLVPVALLYGTPENAVAELRYLRALHIALRGVELGEEPDGQLVSPEDYGALYVQFARAIRRAFPHLPIGGPAFGSSIPDWAYWPNVHGDRSWTHRFVEYLRARHALRLLGFFSFEWYPFDDVCATPARQLARAAAMLRTTIAEQHREGIPHKLPVYVTEYGFSAYAGEDEVSLTGALFDADTVGTLLSEGVAATYLYGYEPNVPIREAAHCNTWGNLMLLRERESGSAPQPVATFWETQMLTHDWAQAGAGGQEHLLYRATARTADLHAYALRRPDGRLALLVLNLSSSRYYRVRIRLAGAPGRLSGALEQWTLSSADYAWQADGPDGAPSLDEPPRHRLLGKGRAALLPPYSVSVLRSALG